MILTMLERSFVCLFILCHISCAIQDVNLKLSRVYGPGLQPHIITMPARYFFIEAVNNNNERFVPIPKRKCISLLININLQHK